MIAHRLYVFVCLVAAIFHLVQSEVFEGIDYLLVEELHNFTDAWKYCNNMNATLLAIESDRLNMHLKTRLDFESIACRV